MTQSVPSKPVKYESNHLTIKITDMITFKNFKNFAEAEIDLSKPMTLLIGRNGSDKSNIIEGIELLSEFFEGREVHDISDVGRGGEFEIRGGIQGCFKQGKK